MSELTLSQYQADTRMAVASAKTHNPILEVLQRQARLERIVNQYPVNNQS